MRAMLVLATVALATTASAPHGARSTNRPAPPFELPALRGTASLDSLRGHVVYVDFWASWCEPCRKSFPWMKTMAQRYGGQGFEVVAIDLDKQRSDAMNFLGRYDAPFTVAFDPSGHTAETYAVAAMPTSFLVDRRGIIIDSHAGFDPRGAVRAESLIAEACAR